MSSRLSRRFARPAFRVGDVQGSPPTVYVLAPDFDEPSGGIRVMYRHVDILNEGGVRARILHRRHGFRCTWFDNDTMVSSSDRAFVGPDDTLVIGELDIDLVTSAARPVRHIVLNQNSHLTWQHCPDLVSAHYACPRGLLGVIVVSEHNAAYLSHAVPTLAVRRVVNGVDPQVFYRTESTNRVIAYHPRRGAADAEQVVGILGSRGVLDNWAVRRFDSMPQADFAAALRQTRVFLSTTYHEGFGLPAAEAMASGCYVVGYHGFGGRELMDTQFSWQVPTGDVLQLAKAIEAVLEHDREDDEWCATRGRMAARFVEEHYSREVEVKTVLAAYHELLSR